MTAEARSYLTNWIIIGFFALIMMFFVVQFPIANNGPIINDTSVANASASLSAHLNDFTSNSNATYSSFNKAIKSPSPIQIFLLFDGITQILFNIVSMSVNTIGILGSLITSELGIEFALLFGIVIAIMLVTIVFLIYKNVRTGS